jgi:acetyl-CoA acetyltransferase
MGATERGTSRAAIAGLGITEMGKVYGRTATDFAADAVRRAVGDAGLRMEELDGLLVSGGVQNDVGVGLARQLGLHDLRMLAQVQGFGATASLMVGQAAGAIADGRAEAVACVFADAPLRPKTATGGAYAASSAGGRRSALDLLPAQAGLLGANPMYALAARRHMETYGTTSEQLGAVAVQTRAWATMNPIAQMRDPIALEDHQSSRFIAEPLHLLDCCLVSNGGVAIVVVSPERAAALAQPPVHVLGYGQCHPGYTMERGSDFGLVTGARRSGADAMAMAGIGPDDVDVREIYDCYTYTTLVTLEDYGFCAKGEGGAFVESGALGPGGSHPTNTGGGQLSGYYMWGMTPLAEAVIQTRGQGGERQVQDHDVVLVSGNGGILDHHGTIVLSPHAGH